MTTPPGTTQQNPRLAVQCSGGQFRVAALDDFAAGEVLLLVNGPVVDHPSRYSVQIGANEHVDPPVPDPLALDMDQHPWRFLNHSCEPNARLQGRTLVARRDIAAGEEVTFDYATTEYEMAAPFPCGCGSPSCRGVIRGFASLTAAQQQALAPHLAPHLRALLTEPTPTAGGTSPTG